MEAPVPKLRLMTSPAPRRVDTLARARSHDPDADSFPDETNMSALAKKIVVVGGGNAAGYFARACVAAGRGSELTIVAAENVLPYERPALTKGFLHKEGPPRLPGFHTCVGGGGERQTQEWYDANGVEVLLNTRVCAADLPKKTITTADGVSITYDTLVVATGCTALKLPASIGGALPGVHYVRDNADALALYDAMGSAKRAVVVGGGYVGLEVAAALASWGLEPRVVLMESHVMSRLWTPTIAAHYEALYESKGVVFHRGAKVREIIAGADGAVSGVALESGETLACDLVVVGVGAGCPTAPFDALDSTPDKIPGGIKVDATFAASGAGVEPKSVYAVGDVAAFPLAVAGGALVRMEHVAHARASAAHAAAAVLDPSFDEPYEYFPFFYSRVFEQKDSARKVAWVFYGVAEGETIVVGDFAPKLAAFWIDGGRVVGGMLESGAPEENAAVEAAAKARKVVDVEALRACATAEEAVKMVADA